jgi:hypothetical protein
VRTGAIDHSREKLEQEIRCPKWATFQPQIENLNYQLNIHGFLAWLWFLKSKARPKPSPGHDIWLGLAWPVWLGLAWLLA